MSESNSVVGQIVARDYDDSPVPFTGRVLGQVDEEILEVAGGGKRAGRRLPARHVRAG